MRKTFNYKPANFAKFKNSLIYWANQFDVFCILDSNNCSSSKESDSQSEYHLYESIMGIGKISDFTFQTNNELKDIQKYLDSIYDWSFNHICYDFKNYLERLTSKNEDFIGFQLAYFFQPLLLFVFKKDYSIEINYHPTHTKIEELKGWLSHIEKTSHSITEKSECSVPALFKAKVNQEEYISVVNKIQQQIIHGNIYELNYCISFIADKIEIDPIKIWLDLIKASPAPFSCLYKNLDNYLISSSPERFIQKRGNSIVSQPMKGTIKRGITLAEEEEMKNKLINDLKERSENIMITDLVRNDLSRFAHKDTVFVEELCGLYAFKNVYQLISTIKATVDNDISLTKIIKSTFPMGSMTGAPKIRAMELIDEYENFARGLFSGTVGYYDPNNDFDYNVVIRSILYNKTLQRASINVGSAITALSDPLCEYDECMLKAKALLDLFSN